MKKAMMMIAMVLTMAVVVNFPSVTHEKNPNSKVKNVHTIRQYDYDPGY